jgi:hypothetical protein
MLCTARVRRNDRAAAMGFWGGMGMAPAAATSAGDQTDGPARVCSTDRPLLGQHPLDQRGPVLLGQAGDGCQMLGLALQTH